MNTSQRISPHHHREGWALAAVSLFLFGCAFLLTIALLLGGYALVDVWVLFVRVTGG
jgi:hypothetical protein